MNVQGAAAKVVARQEDEPVVELSPITQDRIGFEQRLDFETVMREVFAIGEEKGGMSFGYATVVCNKDGSPAKKFKVLRHKEGWITKFRFDEGEVFIVIRVKMSVLTVTECVLNKTTRGYRLSCVDKVQDLAIASIALDLFPSKLVAYQEAIAATIQRYACENCQHTHYGK